VTFKETMAWLKKNGTDQNIKVYKRHGAGENVFGVSFSNLNYLVKINKLDHDLALSLWETGNTDAQTLALKVANPKKLTKTLANQWIKQISYRVLAGELAELVSKTSFASEKMEQWTHSPKEFYRYCGYSIMCELLKENKIISKKCVHYISIIEKEIHESPNLARYAMNMALTAIGIYVLKKEAINAAKKIGKVNVDHGKTGCKTPDAEAYIKKALSRNR
jgi:3-methyladenine DNA glycosylase AlkD